MSSDTQYTNALIHETSPYLLQHAHNPVNWFAWGTEALQKARAENKLLLVSIGYSACHWCHVMERESFENEEIAKLMNEFFVCIKVDREEHPDVDQVYMNAVHLMRGQGGWPLNCFAMPDGRPVFGGTYFPPAQWKQTIKTLHQSFKDSPQKFEEYAQQLLQGIAQSDIVEKQDDSPDFNLPNLHKIYEKMAMTFDHKEGGFGGAPKFPLPIGLEFLLQYGNVFRQQEALDFTFLTLDKIARGGIYDQIGGGFARYSVDNHWLVPHFEKMLYDNAQLISLYSKAYKITQNKLYQKTIAQSIDFITRELTSPEGAFYCALDADSENVEGKNYVWTAREIKALFGGEATMVMDVFQMTEHGNWEEVNIAHCSEPVEEWADRYGLSVEAAEAKMEGWIEVLLAEREKRVKPGLDDKILTAWNALMISAFVDAWGALGNDNYLAAAEKNAAFIWENMKTTEGGLFRTYKNKKAKIKAFLDDYALTISAFVALYQATFKKKYLEQAISLLDYCQRNFIHESSPMFYYSEASVELVARKMEISDNVIPAANSIMAHNLLNIGNLTENESLVEQSWSMLKTVQPQLLNGRVYYSNWDLLLLRKLQPQSEVVVLGQNAPELNKELQKHLLFNVLMAGNTTNDAYISLLENRYQQNKTLIYVCTNHSCQLPVDSVGKALDLLHIKA